MCKGCYNCRESFNTEIENNIIDDVTKISRSAIRSRRAGAAVAVRGEEKVKRRSSRRGAEAFAVSAEDREDVRVSFSCGVSKEGARISDGRDKARASDTGGVSWRKALLSKED